MGVSPAVGTGRTEEEGWMQQGAASHGTGAAAFNGREGKGVCGLFLLNRLIYKLFPVQSL